MKPVKRNLSLVGIASIVVSLALLAPPAFAAKKPELAITQAQLTSKRYAFKDDPPAFIAFEDVTKNVGNARAGRTSTELVITHGNIEERIGLRPVPALAPGKKDAGEKLVRWPAVRTLPAGAYRLFVCADAKKKVQRQRHCKKIRGQFFVTKKTWDGSLSGHGDWPFSQGAVESWQSTDAKFTFSSHAGGGVFLFNLTGTVFFKDEGTTTTGCTYTGSYVLGNPTGTLTLDYLSEQYAGTATTSPTLYPVQTTCGDQVGPLYFNYFNTALLGGARQPLRFGTERITGSAFIDDAINAWDVG